MCEGGGGKHIGPIHYQMAINGSTNAHLNSVFKEELAMYRTGPQGPNWLPKCIGLYTKNNNAPSFSPFLNPINYYEDSLDGDPRLGAK